jgi:eukaryotic-like serine/threonine-protein kinase
MALSRGTRLGPYEIIAAAGAGGMGEVYKAHDTRLERTVAIKVLSDNVAEDAEAQARFAREARAISSLDHQHICALYDVGEDKGVHYLVMQYLEGETLADRLTSGPMPIEQVLQCGIQIADALDWAHRRGITHRDLKPGNVMLTRASASRQGRLQAKLLDFGLAKPACQTDPVSVSGATRVSDHPVTAEGTILGTISYLSPEQVEGKSADARSDIFALGTVLYEMATGRRPFEGSSPASVMGAILKDDPPPITAARPLAPFALQHVVEACLAKDPDERWQSASDVKRELEWITSTLTAPNGPWSPPASGRKARLGWMVAVAVLLVALAGTLPTAWREWFRAPHQDPLVRFEVTSPTPLTAGGGSVPAAQLAVSPDGRHVAFVANSPGSRGALWIKALDAREPQMLAGTDDASYPFWSPDSRFIGFFARSKLKKIDIAGGPPQILCNATPEARGGSWNSDGVIIFAPGTVSGLMRVPASTGGEPTRLLDLQKGETSHRWPSFLPDGRHFLFFVRAKENEGIYVGAIDSPARQLVMPQAGYNAVYARPGYLLTFREGTLLAYPFDERALKVTGEPVRVTEVGGSSLNFAAFSASSSSETGVLAYSGPLTMLARLEWFDRSGTSLGIAADVGDYVSFRMSPDGRQLAFSRADRQRDTADIYLMDLARKVETRFTSDAGSDVSPVWSPDGSRIVFRSDRAGGNFPFLKPSNGAEPERQLGSDVPLAFPTDWSRDGKFLVGHNTSLIGSYDVMTLELNGAAVANGAKPVDFANSEFA